MRPQVFTHVHSTGHPENRQGNLLRSLRKIVAGVATARGLSVPRLAEDLGLAVRGRTFRCPNAQAHTNGDRNPSAVLYDAGTPEEHLHCFACGKRFDALELLRLRGLSFQEAKEALGQTPSPKPSPSRQSGISDRPSVIPKMVSGSSPKPADVASLRSAVWEAVAPLALTPEAEAWLRGRGINPAIAWQLGCRDFAPVGFELRRRVLDFAPEAQAAAGFANAKGLWWPLRGLLNGREGSRGLAIPAWWPGEAAPRQWRWRFFKACEINGRPCKSAGMPEQSPLPLGLELPPAERGRAGWLEGAAGAEVVVIAEGEPDWLSLVDAAQVNAGCLGLCILKWEPAWAGFLARAKRVIVALHDSGNGRGRDVAADVERSVLSLLGHEAAGNLRFRLFPDHPH